MLRPALPRSGQRGRLGSERCRPLRPPGHRHRGALPDRYGRDPPCCCCCCPRCPGGAGRGSELLSVPALPADRPGRGAGTGQEPTPEAVGQLWTEAAVLPFPGTPARTAELSGPQHSPRAPGLGREGTGPAVPGGTSSEPLGSAGRELLSPASPGGTSAAAPVQAGTDPAATQPPGTDPAGRATAEGATAVQGTLSHSPSVTVPGSARGQWRSSSSLRGWRALGTALVQSQNDSLQLGGSSPGTRPSTMLATGSSALGTAGTSPFAGGLQRLLTPTGTLQGTHWPLPGLAEGASHPQEHPSSAPHPSALSLGAGGGPLASTARPAVGTGPALLLATRRGSGLPVPTTVPSSPGVTSPGQGGALGLTTGVLGPAGREGPPEPSHTPLSPSAIPGQSPVPLAPGSTAVAQGGVAHASPGPSPTPLSPEPAPASSSAVTPLSTPLPSPGTGKGVLGFGPTVGDPSPGLPHSSSREGPAESPPSLGGAQVGVGSLEPPSAAPGPPQQPALSQPSPSLGPTTALGATTTGATAAITTATSPERLRDVGTVTAEPRAAVLQRDVVGPTWGTPAHVPSVMPGAPQQPTGSQGGGPGAPPAAADTQVAQPSSSPRGRTDTDAPLAGVGRAPQVFIVEDQPPLLKGQSGVSGSSAGAGLEWERPWEPPALVLAPGVGS